jgi:hypothetical protein
MLDFVIQFHIGNFCRPNTRSMTTIALPPAAEQVSIIKNLEQTTKLQPGGKAYIIAGRWFESWRRSVGYLCYSRPSPDIQVGPIDNSPLLVNGTWTYRQPLRENSDFYLLVKCVWDQLREWYTGGPEIALDVFKDHHSAAVVVTRKLKVRVSYKTEQKDFLVHRFETVGAVRERATAAFSVDTRTRLQSTLSDRPFRVLDNTTVLNDRAISENELFILDFQETDGSWSGEPAKPHISPGPREAGAVGFQNIGNTCYFNASLQCLVHTRPLVRFFVETDWREHLNRANPLASRGNAVAIHFGDVLQCVWSGRSAVVRPDSLKTADITIPVTFVPREFTAER